MSYKMDMVTACREMKFFLTTEPSLDYNPSCGKEIFINKDA